MRKTFRSDNQRQDQLFAVRAMIARVAMLGLVDVNRLIAPRSELSIHEKWFSQTAMAALLDSDERMAEKDRLYRALDRMVDHKD